MKDKLRGWKHVFKLDPDRIISDESLRRICESGTHAVMIGGSRGVNYANTLQLLTRLRQYPVPNVLEISSREAVVPGVDLYFIPIVLNTKRVEWILGHHHQAVKEFGSVMPWEQIAAEAYIILNSQSSAAEVTGSEKLLDVEDVVSYARIAENLFRFPVLYLENSGKFGDMELVRQSASVLVETRLFYGGGIDNLEKAEEAAAAAHTIVVGNALYDHFEQALETVEILNRS